jgi:hypothetical protein
VIGLNLCPFAEGPYRGNRVRLHVSGHDTAVGLLDEVRSELAMLAAADPGECETTLLVHPLALADFMQYNDFLAVCEQALIELDLEGVIQIASFHPQYQFAGTQPEDIENCTNRSPYPMLHLLREASVERAVAAFGDTEQIYRKNIGTLRALGRDGWTRLWID